MTNLHGNQVRTGQLPGKRDKTCEINVARFCGSMSQIISWTKTWSCFEYSSKKLLGRKTVEKLPFSHNKHVNHQHLSHDVHCSKCLSQDPTGLETCEHTTEDATVDAISDILNGKLMGKMMGWWAGIIRISWIFRKRLAVGFGIGIHQVCHWNSFVCLLWLMVLGTNNTDYTNSWTWSTRITRSTAKNTTKTTTNGSKLLVGGVNPFEKH